MSKGALGDEKNRLGPQGGSADRDRHGLGLKGRTDGYVLNEAIKILMAEKPAPVEKGLRAIGIGVLSRVGDRPGPRERP